MHISGPRPAYPDRIAECRKRKEEDGKRKAESGKGKTKAESGKWKAESGNGKAENGKRKAKKKEERGNEIINIIEIPVGGASPPQLRTPKSNFDNIFLLINDSRTPGLTNFQNPDKK